MKENNHISVDLFRFLKDLKANNDREWFLKNKDRYESVVQKPLLSVISELAPTLHEISPYLVASQKGSLFRIYRDIRFSKNKEPYKTYVAAKFFHSKGKDEPAPVFYLHLDTEHSFLACGVWRPAPELRTRIARQIASNPKEWVAVSRSKSFLKFWAMGGETMKKMPRGFDPDHELVDELIRKEFIAFKSFSDEEVTSPKFSSTIKSAFQNAAPFMAFLTRASGFPWQSGDEAKRVDPLNNKIAQRR